MKLYHGTSETKVPNIIRDGIKPRGKAGGNWKHSIESNPKAVYLTDAYALYFAGNATDPSSNERLAVVEIDTKKLNPLLLAPDEDFLEQATRKRKEEGFAPIDKPMKYRTRWYRRHIMDFADSWKVSLDGLGTCTYYGTIPASAVTRIAFIERKAYHDMIMIGGIDPTITLVNYHIVGDKYRHSIKRLFGDTDEVYHGMHFDFLSPENQQAYIEADKVLWSTGIEVRSTGDAT